MLQGDAGDGLCLKAIQRLQQIVGKRGRQLGLALGFLGIECQLQDPAIIPVVAALQVFQQAPGMAEAAHDHL